MKNRTVHSALIIALLLLGITSSPINANDKAPVFVDCPGNVNACMFDSVFVQVKAVHPNSEKAKSIRYFLVEGLGEVDSITGIWSMLCCYIEPPYPPQTITIGASIGKSPHRTFAEENCSFEVNYLVPLTPRFIFDGQKDVGTFEIRAHQTLEIPISFQDPYECGIDISIESIEPYFVGNISFVDDTTLSLYPSVYDIGKRFTIKMTAISRGAVGHGTIVADDRIDVPTPVFVECPEDTIAVYPCSYSFFSTIAHDPLYHDSVGIKYQIIEGPELSGRDGSWYYPYRLSQAGQNIDIELSAGYLGKWTSGDQNCRFTLHIAEEDEYPDFSIFENNPCGDTIQATANERSLVPVQAVHSNFCNKFTYFIESINPEPESEIRFHLFDDDDAIVNVLLEFAEADIGKTFAIKIGAARYPDTSFCEFYTSVEAPQPIVVRVEQIQDAIQGQVEGVSIFVDQSPTELGGFSFVIAYDPAVLSFQRAFEGEAFYEAGCEWEYFTYRYLQSGQLRVVGIANVNDGTHNPTCYLPENLPAEIARLDFMITNDRTYQCTYTPIRFYWTECGDNSLSNKSGDSLFISDKVIDRGIGTSEEITDPATGYPTVTGDQDADCFADSSRVPYRRIEFYNGGIDIICVDTIDGFGDINLNQIPYEIADAMLFAKYFVYGLEVFEKHPEHQLKITDINRDGLTGTLEDFTQYISIVIGEALPHATSPSLDTVALNYYEGNLDLQFVSEDTIGAMLIVVADSVAPLLEQSNIEYMYHYNGSETRILLYSMEQHPILPGQLLSSLEGHEILETAAATIDGKKINTIIDIALTSPNNGALPGIFALHQNYPNPFNPSTTIRFDLPQAATVRFEVINILGAIVYDFSRDYAAGNHEIIWYGHDNDGNAVASGVYYYRIEAGEFRQARKMILLK